MRLNSIPYKQNQETWYHKSVRYSIAIVLTLVGCVLIGSQSWPLLTSYLNGRVVDAKEEMIVSPVPDNYYNQLEKLPIYDPGQSYFQNLLTKSSLAYQKNMSTYDPSTKKYRKVVIDKDYHKNMKLSIESIGINNVRVTPNVNSYKKSVYNESLKNGLAHFKNTPLPGDGGNSFIYGHSTIQSFLDSNTNNPEIVFSKLEQAEIGDEVTIQKDNKTLRYTVRKKEIIKSSDFSVLKNSNDKETLTLMTCWPLGIGTKRLIVTTERYE